MLKARSAFIVACACTALAATAGPASAVTIGAPPDADASPNCPWGYAGAPEFDIVSHGQTVTAPGAVLDSFSFYVTQLRDSEGFVGVPQTITYKAYVGKWDSTAATVTQDVWQSDPLTVTTSPFPADWETTVQTGGVPVEPGQQYALYFSTHETQASNTSEDQGCSLSAGGNPYADGASLIRYPADTDWRVGVFSADAAFNATFSGFDFDGFYQPVENRDEAGTLILNRVQAGSAVPLKFRLGGDFGLDVFADGYPQSRGIECDSGAEVNSVEETVNAGQSSLQYDAATGIYTYVWKTNKAWEDTCRQLVVTLDDGTTARANFTLK